MKPVDPAISQAFRARALALNLLSPRSDVVNARTLLSQSTFFSSDGWSLFLRVERCAHPLSRVLGSSEFPAHVPELFRNMLRREAEWEMERVSSARRQLRAIGEWALENGCRPIVLKGGVSALDDDACVDLNDVDVLLPKEDGKRLVAALIDRGYEGVVGSTPSHFDALIRGTELPIEIHHALAVNVVHPERDFWQHIEEISTLPGLWCLAPADHLWHVLTHAVMDHPSRRGRLRDLLVLHHATASCSAAEIKYTRQQAGKHELSEPLNRALNFAVRWSKGAVTEDPFEEIALVSYLLAQQKRNRSRVHPTYGPINRWVHALLLGRVERRTIWEEVWLHSTGLSKHRALRRVQLFSPRLGRVIQVSARVLARIVSYARAYPLATSIRRRVTRYLPQLKSRDHDPGPVRDPRSAALSVETL